MNLDVLMRKTWSTLLQDMQGGSALDSFSLKRLKKAQAYLANGDISKMRPLNQAYQLLQPYQCKLLYQAMVFGKRWVFNGDDNWCVIEGRTVSDFVDTQNAVIEALPASKMLDRVLNGATELCSYILGPYDIEEHKRSCRFGSKAAYGLKQQDSYLHNRIPLLSGTKRQFQRWGSWLTEDPQLAREMRLHMRAEAANGRVACPTVTDALNLTIVPKSFKTGRAIVPDTVLGGFISNGFGEMIRKRLKVNAGLDIKRKQMEHRQVARSASRSCDLATADMSKASDRISWPLLQRILPSDWLDIIDTDRIQYVKLPDIGCGPGLNPRTGAFELECNLIKVASPLLMGKGYTFPLQTLVFYSLLLAIANELGIGHEYISVYGDDLIYPVKMHRYVSVVFEKCGLLLNAEKTYASPKQGTFYRKNGGFRESCGGDYVAGQDVRPYMPEGQSLGDISMRKEDYAAQCYALLNGLLERWSWFEIKTTIRFLLIELQLSTGEILVVPNLASTRSGLRIDKDQLEWIKSIDNFDVLMPFPKRLEQDGGHIDVICFSALHESRKTIEVANEGIYMWDSLRRADVAKDEELNDSYLRFCEVPGFREESLRITAEDCKWLQDGNIFETRRVKRYVDKFNRWHEEKPRGISQMRWLTVPVVRQKGKDAGNVKRDRRTCPPHLLFVEQHK